MPFRRWFKIILGISTTTTSQYHVPTIAERDLSTSSESPSVDSIHSSVLSQHLEVSQYLVPSNTPSLESTNGLPQLPESPQSPGSVRDSTSSTASFRTTPNTPFAGAPDRPGTPRPPRLPPVGSPSPLRRTMMPFNRGRFPANNPMLPARGTPSPEPEAFEETTQNSPSGDEPMSSRKLRDRSDSISPPPDYVPPPRDHSPPPPTLQIPEPTLPPPGYKIPKSPPQDPSLPPSTCKLPAPRKYFKHRQELVDEYLAALAQKRNDSNIDYKLLSEAAAIMTKQLKAQHEWLNPNAQLRLSLPGWFVPGVAEAQDHLLHRMKYTGWAQRGPEAIAQQWVHGVYKDGPGQAARDLAIRKRGLISPF